MNPPRVLLKDLQARLGAETCKAYAASIRDKSPKWLEGRGIDPESILIRNLELDSTDSERLYVADDGCGNQYFVDSDDAEPLVFLDSHDPPGIEETGLSLEEFWSTLPLRKAAKAAKFLTICRTDLPQRSILNPITQRE